MKTDVDYIIKLMKKFTTTNNDGEIGEQEAASAAGGSTGDSGQKPEYPTVTKWSSGRKFGPTYNPDQKVWNGNGIVRGKANTLL